MSEKAVVSENVESSVVPGTASIACACGLTAKPDGTGTGRLRGLLLVLGLGVWCLVYTHLPAFARWVTYALIGLTLAAPALFDAMTWGTDIVMEKTRQRLRNLGWRWHELPAHWDLDRPEDYQRLVREGGMPNAKPVGQL